MQLRVWWNELVKENIIRPDVYQEKQGSVINVYGSHLGYFAVRIDNGTVECVECRRITKSEWIKGPEIEI